MKRYVNRANFLKSKSRELFMHILHAYYQPGNPGGILFWVEISNVPAPKQGRARTVKKSKPRLHPYRAEPAMLKNILYLTGVSKTAVLRLPAVHGVPLPSPLLIHNRELEIQEPKLDSFLINGIWMKAVEALPILLTLASSNNAAFSPAPDLHYWSMVGALTLETLAAHKLIPVLVSADG